MNISRQLQQSSFRDSTHNSQHILQHSQHIHQTYKHISLTYRKTSMLVHQKATLRQTKLTPEHFKTIVAIIYQRLNTQLTTHLTIHVHAQHISPNLQTYNASFNICSLSAHEQTFNHSTENFKRLVCSSTKKAAFHHTSLTSEHFKTNVTIIQHT